MALEYLPRIVDRHLMSLLDAVPIVTLEGARATGKTTTASRVASSELRLPRDLALLRSDPEGVLAVMPRPVLVDEWQLAGIDVLWAIKNVVDAAPTSGGFILTGSVQPESYGPTYPLTGRSARLAVYPMNRRELLGHGDSPTWLERLLSGGLFVTAAEAASPVTPDVLFDSGFPPAQLGDPVRWLEAYAASVAERSVESRRDPTRIGRMLRVLAGLESASVPDDRIITTADVNRATFRAYDDMLARAFVVTPALAWSTNRLKRLTTFPKRYLCDPALALALAGVGIESLRQDPALAGAFLDSFVAAQLRPEVAAAGGAMYHVRTKAGEHEIDQVLEIGDRLVAIEVKWVMRPDRSDARHLQWFRQQLGDRVAAAVVLHRGAAAYELVPGVWALPVSSMWT